MENIYYFYTYETPLKRGSGIWKEQDCNTPDQVYKDIECLLTDRWETVVCITELHIINHKI